MYQTDERTDGVMMAEPAGTATDQAVRVVRDLYRAFAEGDVPAVVGRMDAGIVWIGAEGHPYSTGALHGPEAVLRNVFARLASEWTEFRAAPREFFAEGDRVVVLGEYTGVFNAAGRPLRAPFAHVWQVEKGRVSGFRQITDTHLVRVAMNAV